MRVEAEISQVTLLGERCSVAGVCATCTRCGHETESYGTGEGSVTRCLVLLREECPMGEDNFYVEEGEDC